MSNFDINAIISELSQRLGNSELKNVFELNDMFFFRFRTKTEGTQLLAVELGKRIHITKFKRNFPETPSGLCKAFRIHIKGKWLKRIYQYDFDRIVVMEFEAFEKVYTLIIELFGKGNVILVSPENKVLVAKNYKKMRDRDIHPGREFLFPPSSGRNFLEAKIEWIREQLNERTEKDLVTLISKTLNINKQYAEEICLLAGVNKELAKDEITDEIIDKTINGVNKLREYTALTKLEPTSYYEKEELIDIVPFPMKIYEQYEAKSQESFSQALDEYFSTLESDKESNVELSAEEKRINQVREVLRKQQEHLEQLLETVESDKQKGALIYQYLVEIDELLTTITNARRNNISWNEIKEKLFAAKEKKMKGARLLKEIHEKNKSISVELDGETIALDFLKSGSENAADMYQRAKKAEAKVPGAQKKIDEFSERIRKMEEGLDQLANKETIMIERRKKEWYEKFHWFKSSDGFLVIAGKDLRSNNELVKKYLEDDDIFLHAEIHGAAVVVIKGEGKEIPQSTINEAAIFSVSYSKAWKDRMSSENTFWVKPDQVSFSAPTGEYLAKGSFVIKGSKNILKNIPLEIAVAPVIEEKSAYIVGGPISALKNNKDVLQTKIIEVIPGDTLKSKAAEQIVSYFLQNIDDIDAEKIKANAKNELISIIPGDCYIKK